MLRSAVLMLLVSASSAPALADLVAGGDITVLEVGNESPPVAPALIRIDPVTGSQSIISEGGLLEAGRPRGFAFDPDTRSFLVLQPSQLPGTANALIRVSAVDGSQQRVSPFLVSLGQSILVEAPGTYLVSGLRAVIGGVDVPINLVRFDPISGLNAPVGGDFRADYMQLDGSGGVLAADSHRIARVELATGEVRLIGSPAGQGSFQGFAVSGNGALVAVSSSGPPASSDQVVRVDLASGQLTPLFTGLQRVVDVAIDSLGRRLVLDQCEAPTPCAGTPVVYRENASGRLEPLSSGGHLFAASRFLVLPDSLVPPDFDADGVRNPDDNCRAIPNPDQLDSDRNGVGDACNDADDADGDEWADPLDTCPSLANPEQTNSDTDPLGDACDDCPAWPNPDQLDLDQNGIGDACECGDQSGDGRVNVLDLVAINLAIFDPAQAKPLCDTNSDGRCDVRDILGANRKIFGQPAWCSRYPPP